MHQTALELNGKPLSFKSLTQIGQRSVALSANAEALVGVGMARIVVEDAIAERASRLWRHHRRRRDEGRRVVARRTSIPSTWAWSAPITSAPALPFPMSVVRNAMAIRVNTALTGRVGVSKELVDTYLSLLSADVVPVVRRTGSIGCADIGLMGQIGAVLTGVGEAYYQNRRLPAEAALAEAGLKPAHLKPRDSLASISVNAVAYAAAAEAVRTAASAVRILLATSLTTAGALGASRDPWKAVAHVGTQREGEIGGWLYRNAMGWDWPMATHIQDPLSLRMMSQVFGTTFKSLFIAGQTILDATGRTDDNPVVVEGEVLTSGGSLPLDVTVFLETAQIALAHAARNSFNRCVLLGNGVRRDLPINLVPPGAIATGFGPIIKLAGELFTRVLSMANPVSAQSLVVAAGLEDEAAFLPLVVERFERQVEALRRLAALEGPAFGTGDGHSRRQADRGAAAGLRSRPQARRVLQARPSALRRRSKRSKATSARTRRWRS